MLGAMAKLEGKLTLISDISRAERFPLIAGQSDMENMLSQSALELGGDFFIGTR